MNTTQSDKYNDTDQHTNRHTYMHYIYMWYKYMEVS